MLADSDYLNEKTVAPVRYESKLCGCCSKGSTCMSKDRQRGTTRRVRSSRAVGTGYRSQIRGLEAAGMSHAEIASTLRVRPSEVEITLALSTRRGRPPKKQTVTSMAAVKRWRSTKRPRTIRAAVECIDYLLGVIDALQHQTAASTDRMR
jgi:hypothetical protein